MSFTNAEVDYLAGQMIGRLATIQPNGTLQVSPVGFSYDKETGTIDIGGHHMSRSRKFRNVAADGRVAFVVDDVPSTDPFRVRCLEIRGHAEAIVRNVDGDRDDSVIRIHPERIISFGVEDTDHAPHELVPNNRNV